MNNIIEEFFEAYCIPGKKFPYFEAVPSEMMDSSVDAYGWFEWKPIKGTLTKEHYHNIERDFGVHFPDSFIKWHSAYYFLDGDCGILRLPMSLPTLPLQEIMDGLSGDLSKMLIDQGLVPFGGDNNDTGPLVFDTRMELVKGDYPIRIYDHEYFGDLDGLDDIIFSSFDKLLECVTYFLRETNLRNHWQVIPDFLTIDPLGAGSEGRHYWLRMAERYKEWDHEH